MSISLRQFLAVCKSAGLDEDQVIQALDERVHEVKAEEAAAINNGGPDDQLEFLGLLEEELLDDFIEQVKAEDWVPDDNNPCFTVKAEDEQG